MSIFANPEMLAMLMGGANMLQASQGGSRDLSKRGLGYALNQGLLGAMQGAQTGEKFKEQAAQTKLRDEQLGLLNSADMPLAPLNNEAYEAAKSNPYRDMSPINRQLAKGMVMGGDYSGLGKLLTKQKTFGNFQDMNEALKAMQTTRKSASDMLAPSRESLRKFGQATDLLNKKKSFDSLDGADDTILIKALASMILPGEAVMEGDIATIVNQQGLPGTIESYLQAFKGNGQLGSTQRQQIYNAMTTLAERAHNENTQIRDQFKTDISIGGFPENAIFRPQMSLSPFPIPPIKRPELDLTFPPGTVPY